MSEFEWNESSQDDDLQLEDDSNFGDDDTSDEDADVLDMSEDISESRATMDKLSRPLMAFQASGSSNNFPPTKRQKYSFFYQILSPTALRKIQTDSATQVASVTRLSLNDAYLLLQDFRWDKERLTDHFFDTPDAVLDAAGIIGLDRTRSILQPSVKVGVDVSCGICLETIAELGNFDQSYIKLPCSHEFCHDCFSQYLNIKIIEGSGYARKLLCPSFNCSLNIGRNMIIEVVEPDIYRKYLDLMDLCYVKDHPRTMKYCPCPDCTQVVICQNTEDDTDVFDDPYIDDDSTAAINTDINEYNANDGGISSSSQIQHSPKILDSRSLHYPIPIECRYTEDKDTATITSDYSTLTTKNKEYTVVETESTHHFCFRCLHQANHSPSPCELLKLWFSKEVKDSATFQWLQVNSKDCPFCNSPVQKNGGCNRIPCKCGKEFCWTCLKKWHGYDDPSCNAFVEPPLSEQAQSVRVDLERYLHYFERYKNHENSIRLSQQWVVETEKKMACLQSDGILSFIEVQFLPDALNISVQCRQTLMYTYVIAFYLSRTSNHTHIFEANQNDLEKATESLSELIERPAEEIPILKSSIMDRMKYCEVRRIVLEQDFLMGLRERRWTFAS